jgi:hypothetical protein
MMMLITVSVDGREEETKILVLDGSSGWRDEARNEGFDVMGCCWGGLSYISSRRPQERSA